MNGAGRHDVVRTGALSALAAAVLLVGMAVVGAPAGDALGALSRPAAPEHYGDLLRPAVPALLRILALDNLFVIGYTGAFVGAGALVWSRARVLAATGLAFAILTGLLDLTENALAVHVLQAVQVPQRIPAILVAALSVLGQVKYAGAGLALAFFGLALLITRPASRTLTLGAASVFLLFPAINALAVVEPANARLLAAWMLVSLLASAGLLWAASRPG